MEKQYIIKVVDEELFAQNLLMSIRHIKAITERGLREVKGIWEMLRATGEVIVIVENPKEIDIDHLNDIGLSLMHNNERDLNLDTILLKFSVQWIGIKVTIFVMEGSFEILDNNVLEVICIDGIYEDGTKSSRDKIVNQTILLPFTECIVNINSI